METLVQIIFALIGALILGSAVMVVSARNIIHAALWLIASFFGVAALYLLLEAEFIAVVQVLVYVGAVSILILFAIMLTRQISGEGVRQLYPRWWLGLIVAVVLFAAILIPSIFGHGWHSLATSAASTQASQPIEIASAQALGAAFMRDFLLPFEVASVLLLVALIGAIVIAFEERPRRHVLTLIEEFNLNQRKQQAAAASVAHGKTAELEEGSRP